MGKATFRNAMYTSYKQNRPATRRIDTSIDYVKDISEQFGFVNIGVANYEADDVIGTLAKIYSKDNEVHIVTGDRDILQCINEQVEVWLIRKGFNIYHHYTLIVLMKSMHYIHFNLLILKHLWEIQQMGILVLKVLGKTAIKLIQSYGSVENVLDHIESLTPGQQKKLQLIKKI